MSLHATKRVVAAIVVLAAWASLGAPVRAAPSSAEGVGATVAITQSIVGSDGPSHHFGFSQASVLSQITSIQISKTGSPATVNVGATLNYTVTVTNPVGSAVTATNVTVTDTLPANVNFVSASSSVGTCTGTPGVTTVTCNVGTLVSGQSATITIAVFVPPTVCLGVAGGFGTDLGFPGGFGTNLGGSGLATLTNTASATGTGLVSATSTAVTTSVTCLPFPPGQFPPFPLLPPPPLEFLPPPPPPLLPPPPPQLFQPGPSMAGFPDVPVIPEADTVFLFLGGLVALGAVAGLRSLRRREE